MKDPLACRIMFDTGVETEADKKKSPCGHKTHW